MKHRIYRDYVEDIFASIGDLASFINSACLFDPGDDHDLCRIDLLGRALGKAIALPRAVAEVRAFHTVNPCVIATSPELGYSLPRGQNDVLISNIIDYTMLTSPGNVE